MGDREDSPDWLRSFQAPTRSVTTLSSDSGGSGDKSPTSDCSLDDDEKICNIMSSSKTAKKRVNVGDEIPAKRRKIEKDKEGGSKDDTDIEMEECSDKPSRTAAHNHSVWALSSDSESDSNAPMRKEANEELSVQKLSDPMRNEDLYTEEEAASKVAKKGKSPKKKTRQLKLEQVKPKEKKKINSPLKIQDDALSKKEANEKPSTHELSEPIKGEEKEDCNEPSTSKVPRKRKSPKERAKVEDDEPADNDQAKEPLEMEGEVGGIDAVEEALPEKHVESRVSSSTLPLVLSEKVSRTKALVECEGDSIDLSGDMGAVGRVIIPETPSGEPELFLDLKGTIYKTTIVPSRTFCVVSIGQSEAKIEAIMNDFIQLKPQSNVYDAETVVEGTLEGFSFDSEDEADKTTKDVKADQNDGDEEQTGKKPKGKPEKKSGATQKKGKAAGGKQPRKRKPQATKKSKAKK